MNSKGPGGGGGLFGNKQGVEGDISCLQFFISWIQFICGNNNLKNDMLCDSETISLPFL